MLQDNGPPNADREPQPDAVSPPPRTRPPAERWKVLGGLAAVALFIAASIYMPQGPIGWLLGAKAPTTAASACAGLLKSPLCTLVPTSR